MQKRRYTVLLIAVFLIGLSLLLYPTVSDTWNQYHQTRAIMSYAEAIDEIDSEQYDRMLERAYEFNAELAEGGIKFTLTDEELARYESILDTTSTGLIGYIEIPKIGVQLSVAHGTGEAVLQVAAGHLEGTSFPVGGASTHAVITGHRGLPSARLFTDLDKLSTGDTFMIRVLNEVLTYEIDQILIVDPADLSALQIEEGEDYCTLVTCTPYGVNTHRLLVRGHRVDTVEALRVIVTADALQIDTVIVAVVIALPVLVLLAVLALALPRRREDEDEMDILIL